MVNLDDLEVVNELKEKGAIEIVYNISREGFRLGVQFKNTDYIQGRVDQDPLFALHLFDELMEISKDSGQKKKERTGRFSDIIHEKFEVNVPKLVSENKEDLRFTNFYKDVPDHIIEKYN